MKRAIKIPQSYNEAKALAQEKANTRSFKRDWLFWHYHHQGLVEHHDDAGRRIVDIFNHKDSEELPMRVAFLNPVKRIPAWLKKSWDDYVQSRARWRKHETERNDQRMDNAYYRLSQKLASVKNRPAIRRWHNRECGSNCPYYHPAEVMVFRDADAH